MPHIVKTSLRKRHICYTIPGLSRVLFAHRSLLQELPDMPQELFPSSYLCDCGHRSDFFENTIREAKRESQKKIVYLVDSEPEEHTIVFARGELIDILCPKQHPNAPAVYVAPRAHLKSRSTRHG